MSNVNPPPLSKASSKSSSKSSISSHFAMIELKQRVLSSISKLSDRDTHQIALLELQATVQSISPEAIPMLLNCLYDACSEPNKSSVKKDSLTLLALLASSCPEPIAAHLPKIISIVVRRLRDSDSAVRDSCRDAIGTFASLYIREESENSVVSLFVKPLFEALNEQNKTVQTGAAVCLAKMVESARDPPLTLFQKLSQRICKHLSNQNFLAKAALLSVISSLSQIGAITSQNSPLLLKSINDCLVDTDWATRKAAADILSVLASNSSHLVAIPAASIVASLEGNRFDKVKPVRDSMAEALQIWKKIAEKGEAGSSENVNASSYESKSLEVPESGKSHTKRTEYCERKLNLSGKNGIDTSFSPDTNSNLTSSCISEKTVGILKKKVPALTDKVLNVEFFQKLETRVSSDLQVEVVVPPRSMHLPHLPEVKESDKNISHSNRSSIEGSIQNNSNVNFYPTENSEETYNKPHDTDEFVQGKSAEKLFSGKNRQMRVDADESAEINQRDATGHHMLPSRYDGQDGGSFMNNKGNWLVIQRKLAQLERQQTNLMNMLQEFMGGSYNSMMTLENRVQSLESVVEEMARDMSLSSGRGGSNFMMRLEGHTIRPLNKYNSVSNFCSKAGRIGYRPRFPFGERFLSCDGILSGEKRDPTWRADVPEAHGSSRSGSVGIRRAHDNHVNSGRLSKTGHDGDQGSGRRAWDMGHEPVRLGEGPSARSMWQASKDEATLEAIRIAGDDNIISQKRVCTSELISESTDDNRGQEHDQRWSSWIHAMDYLRVGDVDSAYAEVISSGDSGLLVKLMDRSGPVVDQLSIETANEVLCVVKHFLLDQSVLDIGLSWMQQLAELVIENGADFLGIPEETKREFVMSLHHASSVEPPEDWLGATANQLMLQFASLWRINLQQLGK